MMAMAFVLAPLLALAPASEAWVVVVRADASIPASWNDEVQKAAAAAMKKKKVKYVSPPEISTKEIELALACNGWNAACAGQVAGMLGATHTVTVDIVQRGRGAWMGVEVTNAKGKVRGDRKRFDLTDRDIQGLEAAKIFVASTITGDPVTGLVVETDTIGSTVLIDDVVRGVTPLSLYDVTPGSHAVEISQPGRDTVRRTVIIPEGTVEKVAVVLPEVPDLTSSSTTSTAAAPTAVDDGTLGIPVIIGWSVLGAGAVICIVGLASGITNLAIHGAYRIVLPGETHKSYNERIEGLPSTEQATVFALGTFAVFAISEVVGVVVGAAGAGLIIASSDSGDAPSSTPVNTASSSTNVE